MKNNETRQTFLLRFLDGPEKGDYKVVGPWPPPNTISRSDGSYLKKSQSQLPDDFSHPNILKGALYEWSPIVDLKDENMLKYN